MCFIQQWDGLADVAVEDALYDSQALRNFCNIDLSIKSGPYATTLMNFRHQATADHFGFKNDLELTKLVWSNDKVQFLTGGNCGANNSNACNIGRLSHYVGTNGGGTTQVPEPAGLLLLGVGLIGLAYTRRRTS